MPHPRFYRSSASWSATSPETKDGYYTVGFYQLVNDDGQSLTLPHPRVLRASIVSLDHVICIRNNGADCIFRDSASRHLVTRVVGEDEII